MEKEFIPYEQALALKELGFDEKCGACYYKKFDNEIGYHKVYRDFNFVQLTVSAPTFSQAFRWFRDRYKSNFIIGFGNDGGYYRINNVFSTWYKSYEEAELECLKKLIEIVKEK